MLLLIVNDSDTRTNATLLPQQKSNQKISITVSVSRNTNTTRRAVRILSIMRILVLVMNAMTESQYLHLKYTLAYLYNTLYV